MGLDYYWEYKIVAIGMYINAQNLSAELTNLSKEGWSVVHALDHYLVLMREVHETSHATDE
jgi:hypothetical protein